MKLTAFLPLFILSVQFASAQGKSISQTAAQPQLVTSVEGVKEYRLNNGLQILLIPDAAINNVIVNVVYHVGSRNEGYGETGMAHLLEHMMFKITKSGREIFRELTDRTGGSFNGTTNYDQ